MDAKRVKICVAVPESNTLFLNYNSNCWGIEIRFIAKKGTKGIQKG